MIAHVLAYTGLVLVMFGIFSAIGCMYLIGMNYARNRIFDNERLIDVLFFCGLPIGASGLILLLLSFVFI